MLYAKVVVGLPVEGPFDYIVGQGLDKQIKTGVRVWVNFGNKKKLGYVVGLSRKTQIKNLKKILAVIDDYPVLDKNMLSLTKSLSRYYCCSWGEAIETALPEGLRKGKVLEKNNNLPESTSNSRKSWQKSNRDIELIHDLDAGARWDIYLEEIKKVLENNKSAIILLPDINSVLNAKNIIESKLNTSVGILYRKEAAELQEWSKIKSAKTKVVVGTRSAIFAPVVNLGLVIIDDEDSSVYKQDQVPHYRARDIAFMRLNIEKARLILGSTSPALESFLLARQKKIKYRLIQRTKDYPEIKIIDKKAEYRSSREIILSKYLQDCVAAVLNLQGKVLLFLNRRGFATFAACLNCRKTLKCPRCNINLVYHFKGNILNCHYCNFKMPPPKLCPYCEAGYIKFGGVGTEKVESELSRIFPQARVKRLESQSNFDINEADIFVATSSIIKQIGCPEGSIFLGDTSGSRSYALKNNNIRDNFDLVAVLAIDNALNRVDFRAGEKTFTLLSGLLALTDKRFIVQTNLAQHGCFQALLKNDINIFYEEELKQRKQLKFPPFKHMVLVKLRGKKEERVKQTSHNLFEKLREVNKNKGTRIISVNPGQPPKLRGNFYWQILISSDNPNRANAFLKIHLKSFSHSGIIVTVDVDPV